MRRRRFNFQPSIVKLALVVVSSEEVEALWRRPFSTVANFKLRVNLDVILEELWSALDVRRVFTKKPGWKPLLDQPLVLTR